MSSTERIIIKPNAIESYSWDIASLLATDEIASGVVATMTRVVPLPETDVTSTALPYTATVGVRYITLQIDGTLLTVNCVYLLTLNIHTYTGNTHVVQTYIYVRNASPYLNNGVTLRELRQRCGSMLNDMIKVEATEDGTKTTLVDINTITLPTGELKNRIIYFYGGTRANIGSQRTIDSNTVSEGKLIWGRDLPAPVMTGDVAELWNHRAQGIRPLQMNEFIQIAHSEASVYNHTQMTMDIIDGFNAQEPYNTINVPIGVSKIERVQYMNNSQLWLDIGKSSPGGPGYWVDVYSRVLTIGRPISTYANGGVVRLLVRGREFPLEHDEDTTIINAEWLCARACELACTALVNRNPDQNVYRDKMYKYERIAQSMRTLIIPRSRAGTMLEW